jgi:hypothetical protein
MCSSEKVLGNRKTEGIVGSSFSGLKPYDRVLLVGIKTIWKKLSEYTLVFAISAKEFRRAIINVCATHVCELKQSVSSHL